MNGPHMHYLADVQWAWSCLCPCGWYTWHSNGFAPLLCVECEWIAHTAREDFAEFVA